jgi:hypothetical protein
MAVLVMVLGHNVGKSSAVVESGKRVAKLVNVTFRGTLKRGIESDVEEQWRWCEAWLGLPKESDCRRGLVDGAASLEKRYDLRSYQTQVIDFGKVLWIIRMREMK